MSQWELWDWTSVNGPTVSSCQGTETHRVDRDDQVQIQRPWDCVPVSISIASRWRAHGVWRAGVAFLFDFLSELSGGSAKTERKEASSQDQLDRHPTAHRFHTSVSENPRIFRVREICWQTGMLRGQKEGAVGTDN